MHTICSLGKLLSTLRQAHTNFPAHKRAQFCFPPLLASYPSSIPLLHPRLCFAGPHILFSYSASILFFAHVTPLSIPTSAYRLLLAAKPKWLHLSFRKLHRPLGTASFMRRSSLLTHSPFLDSSLSILSS